MKFEEERRQATELICAPRPHLSGLGGGNSLDLLTLDGRWLHQAHPALDFADFIFNAHDELTGRLSCQLFHDEKCKGDIPIFTTLPACASSAT